MGMTGEQAYVLAKKLIEASGGGTVDAEVREQVSSLKKDLVDLDAIKISKPEDTPAVGKVLKIKSVNEDGTFMCEWADDGKFEIVATYNNTASEDTTVDIRFQDCSDVLVEVIVAPHTVILDYGLVNLMKENTVIAMIEFGALSANPVIFSSKLESFYDRGIRRTNFSAFSNVNGRVNMLTKANKSNGTFYSTEDRINRLRGLVFNGTVTINVYGIKA